MLQRDLLRDTVAQFFGVGLECVDGAFPISGPRVQSSLARAALDGAIRQRVGGHCRTVYTAKTYAELEAGLNGLAKPIDVASSTSQSLSASLPLTELEASFDMCGIDIESVSSMPEADDFWEHDFYRTQFSVSEIAYCLLQSDPKVHFAVRWCAKEALKKCDRRFLSAEFASIQVSHGPDQIPFLQDISGSLPQPLPYTLALSHTDDLAMAVVFSKGETRSNLTLSRVQTDKDDESVSPVVYTVAETKRGVTFSIGLSILACLLAVWALIL